MKTRIMMATGILITLATVCGAFNGETHAAAATDVRPVLIEQHRAPVTAGQLLATWNARAATPVSVPLQRPL